MHHIQHSPGLRAETMPSFPKSGLWDPSQLTEEWENSPDLGTYRQPQAELYTPTPRAKADRYNHSSQEENLSPGDPRAAPLGLWNSPISSPETPAGSTPSTLPWQKTLSVKLFAPGQETEELNKFKSGKSK